MHRPHVLLVILFVLSALVVGWLSTTNRTPSHDSTVIGRSVALGSPGRSAEIHQKESSASKPSWLERHVGTLISAFVLVMQVLGFVTSIRAIMETRTSQGAIAWGISLNTFPYVAVPAYWVFGQSKFADYDVVRRKNILASSETGRATARVLEDQEMLLVPETEYQQHQAALLEQLAKLPITRYNDADLLVDGKATFDAIFAGLESATDYILVQFYIMRADELGQKLKRVLIQKALAGVKVYVLYDEMGSKLTKPYIDELRAAGVLIFPFNTTQGKGNRFRLNFRNHRKIVVVDGRIAYVGGSNVGDEYLGKHPTLTPWRDTHVAVRGPVVQFVQVSFVEDWLWAVGSTPNWQQGEERELDWTPNKAPEGDTLALCLPTGPADDLETCTLFTLHAINSAKERLWIVSPYFVPDEQLMSALQLAGLRGVDVRILIPENPDQNLVYWSSFSYLHDAEQAGVKIFRYQKGFLHQKVMLIDDEAATIGTVNFDNRSMRLNFEITMLIGDKDFAKEVEAMLAEDFANSHQVHATDFSEASFWFKLVVRVARLLAPIQ